MIDKEDLDFANNMVIQLDESIQRLVKDDKRISEKMGKQRVEELLEYWNQELTTEESEEIKATFDYWDKMLIFTSARMKRIHDTRAKVGQAVMKNGSI